MEYSGSTQHQHFHLSLKAHLGQCIQGPVPVVVIVLTEVLIGREGEGKEGQREEKEKGRREKMKEGRGEEKEKGEKQHKGYLYTRL